MTKPKPVANTTEKMKYDGGYDAVDVVLPTGRRLLGITRGTVVDVLPNEAKALSVLPGWGAVHPGEVREEEQ